MGERGEGEGSDAVSIGILDVRVTWAGARARALLDEFDLFSEGWEEFETCDR